MEGRRPSSSFFDIKNNAVSILNSLDYEDKVLNTADPLLRIINNQINRNCRRNEEIYKLAFWEFPRAINFALLIKVLYKFLNPDLELEDSKIGNLTILDFDPTISDEDKNKIFEICQVYTKWIFRKDLNVNNPDYENIIKEMTSETNVYYNYLNNYLNLGLVFEDDQQQPSDSFVINLLRIINHLGKWINDKKYARRKLVSLKIIP